MGGAGGGVIQVIGLNTACYVRPHVQNILFLWTPL